MVVMNSGAAATARGLNAKPAIVDAGSTRPRRSKNTLTPARGLRKLATLPESW